jgi:homocysteine S-methyltransferase (EC 2.1.1.10)
MIYTLNKMKNISFETMFHKSRIILTEGAIVERLRREYNIPLDEHIVHAGLIYNDIQRGAGRYL